MNLSNQKKALLKIILNDNKFLHLLLDERDLEIYKHITIDDNGNVIFGKSRYNFINQAFNTKILVPFTDISAKIIRALKDGIDENSEMGQRISNALNQEYLDNILNSDDKNKLVDSLFAIYYHGYNGEFSSSGQKLTEPPTMETDGYVAIMLDGGPCLIPASEIHGGKEFFKKRRK